MKPRSQEGREIDESLKREDAFYRKQAEIEQYGRCPECRREPQINGGRCFECRGRSMVDA